MKIAAMKLSLTKYFIGLGDGRPWLGRTEFEDIVGSTPLEDWANKAFKNPCTKGWRDKRREQKKIVAAVLKTYERKHCYVEQEGHVYDVRCTILTYLL